MIGPRFLVTITREAHAPIMIRDEQDVLTSVRGGVTWPVPVLWYLISQYMSLRRGTLWMYMRRIGMFILAPLVHTDSVRVCRGSYARHKCR